MWTKIRIFFKGLFSRDKSLEEKVRELEVANAYHLQTLELHNSTLGRIMEILDDNNKDHIALVNAIKAVNSKIETAKPKEETLSLEEKDLN